MVLQKQALQEKFLMAVMRPHQTRKQISKYHYVITCISEEWKRVSLEKKKDEKKKEKDKLLSY